MRLLIILPIVSLLPAALGAQATSRDETRRTIRITYGVVDTIARAKMTSEAGSNAVLGGVIGAAVTHDRNDKGRNAAYGALAAGLLTAAAESRHRVDEITITMTDGSTVKVLQDHIDGITAGTCVSVEQGAHTNVRGVSPEHCASTAIRADTQVVARREAEASACDMAKQQLANAQNEEQFEFASRKIRALCH